MTGLLHAKMSYFRILYQILGFFSSVLNGHYSFFNDANLIANPSAFCPTIVLRVYLWRIDALACVCDGEFVFNDSLHYCFFEVYGNLS